MAINACRYFGRDFIIKIKTIYSSNFFRVGSEGTLIKEVYFAGLKMFNDYFFLLAMDTVISNCDRETHN